jgi:hypothetical protein
VLVDRIGINIEFGGDDEIRVAFDYIGFLTQHLFFDYVRLYRKNKKVKRSILIKPKQVGYTDACFKKAKVWELALIKETEQELEPIRKSLKILQSTKNSLNRILSKSTNSTNGEDHG